MLIPFHLCLHAIPSHAASPLPTTQGSLEGTAVALVTVDPTALHTPLEVTFDQALESLAKLPYLLIELDGSFVYSGSVAQQRWQVDGLLFDGAQQLQYVELRGQCPTEPFDALLKCLGWPEGQLLFQHVQHSVFMEELPFRNWAWPEA